MNENANDHVLCCDEIRYFIINISVSLVGSCIGLQQIYLQIRTSLFLICSQYSSLLHMTQVVYVWKHCESDERLIRILHFVFSFFITHYHLVQHCNIQNH